VLEVLLEAFVVDLNYLVSFHLLLLLQHFLLQKQQLFAFFELVQKTMDVFAVVVVFLANENLMLLKNMQEDEKYMEVLKIYLKKKIAENFVLKTKKFIKLVFTINIIIMVSGLQEYKYF